MSRKKSKREIRRKKSHSLLKGCFTFLLFALFIMGSLSALKYFGSNDLDKEDTKKEVDKEKHEILAIKSNISKIYLALNGTKQLSVEFEVIGEPDKTLIWTSENESVATISDGLVTGVGVGNTKIKASTLNGKSYEFDVLVTDLITVPTLNNDKPFLPCGRYTKEEAALLDEILDARVKEAGYGTRGAAVAVARFILLEFPYTIKYFNENGRMAHGHPFIDGEGRYYHKGLYLDSSKFSDIAASSPSGPATWGCTLYDSFLSSYRANGFTCSGFITWILYNSGLETGDVGAGDYPDVQGELSDMGPHQQITYDFMKNGQYKVGDFIARDGHAALIMGISEDTIYTAESLPPKAKVYIYERYSGIVKDPNLTYVINMDNIYPNGEGIYTNMW